MGERESPPSSFSFSLSLLGKGNAFLAQIIWINFVASTVYLTFLPSNKIWPGMIFQSQELWPDEEVQPQVWVKFHPRNEICSGSRGLQIPRVYPQTNEEDRQAQPPSSDGWMTGTVTTMLEEPKAPWK